MAPSPSKHPILQAADKLRDDLLRDEHQAALRMVNAYGNIYRDVKTEIDRILDLYAREPTLNRHATVARLRRLQRRIAREMSDYAKIVDNELDIATRRAVEKALEDSRKLVQLSLPGLPYDQEIMSHWIGLSPDVVLTSIGFLGVDSPLRTAWTQQFGAAVASGVADQMISGITMGWGPARIAREARRQFGVGLTWAMTHTRTAQLWAYRETSRKSFQVNPHIVKGWYWYSAMDNRTCMACITQHGTFHTNDEVLDDHYNGRCCAVPATVTYRELGYDVDEEPLEMGNSREWFEAQTEATQRQMMGNAKYEAWRAGAIRWQDLATKHTDPVYGEMTVEASLKSILGEGAKEFYRS